MHIFDSNFPKDDFVDFLVQELNSEGVIDEFIDEKDGRFEVNFLFSKDKPVPDIDGIRDKIVGFFNNLEEFFAINADGLNFDGLIHSYRLAFADIRDDFFDIHITHLKKEYKLKVVIKKRKN